MDRNDWVFVGVRLFGLFLVVQGLLALPGIFIEDDRLAALAPFEEGQVAIVREGLRLLVGVLLFLGAPRILSWLRGKDVRAAAYERGQERRSGGSSAGPR